MLSIRSAQLPTPFGFVIFKYEDQQFSIQLSTTPASEHDNIVDVTSDPLFDRAAEKITDYLNHPLTPINLTGNFSMNAQFGTPYQKRVWEAIATIPPGEVRSYSEVAGMIDSCPRATANACGANHLPILIPCHRVVAKHSIGGFMRGKQDGLQIKKWLLNHEGMCYE